MQSVAPAKKSKNGLVIGVIIGLILLLLVAVICICILLSKNAEVENERNDREHDRKESEVISTETSEEQKSLIGEIGFTKDEAEAETVDVAATAEETDEAAEAVEEAEAEEVIAILGDDSVDASAIHKYQIVMEDITWSEAYLKSMEVNGGYLVHINSQEEMDAILAQIAEEGHEDGIFWIGGMRSPTKDEYYWIDTQMNTAGEALNNESYWLDGEPSLYDSSIDLEECYMNMFYVKSAGKWIWNDTILDLVSVAPGYTGKIGYIIEIEE